MIHHHPNEDLLRDYAAGKVSPGAALAIACHLGSCAFCRNENSLFENLGGALLSQVSPVPLSDGALGKVLARLDDAPTRPNDQSLPAYLARFPLPAGLKHHKIGARRWVAPGIWFAPLKLQPLGRGERTYLVHADKNTTLPRHTHARREFTAVLYGSYRDSLGSFAAGDFSEADNTQWHAPSVMQDQDCLCLVHSDGPMELERFGARMIQTFAGRLY